MEGESAVELRLVDGGPVHPPTEVVRSHWPPIRSLEHVIVGLHSPSALKVIGKDAHDEVRYGDPSD
jgi:hypothetical protein